MAAPTRAQTPAQPLESAIVTGVVDGDTITVRIGRSSYKLRYIGVDSPETAFRKDCYGTQATAYNKYLVAGQTVMLERDVRNVDKYGRLLRYVWLPDGRMVNEEMARGGFAVAASYPPDVKYQDRLRTAAAQARTSRAGLWGACRNIPELPATPGPSAPDVSLVAPPVDAWTCPDSHPVKGNVTTTSRIYHLPGTRPYRATKPEICFATAEAALADGFRAPR